MDNIKKAKGGYLCSALNCKNRSSINKDVSYFSFPKDRVRSKKWVTALRRKDLMSKSYELLHKNNKVCSNHFELSMFANEWKSRLYSHALPTLSRPPNPPPQESGEKRLIIKNVRGSRVQPKVEVLPETINSEHSYSRKTPEKEPEEIDIKEEIKIDDIKKTSTTSFGTQTEAYLSINTSREKKLKAKISMLRKDLRLAKRNIQNKKVPEHLAWFFESQLQEFNKNKNGRRYSRKLKEFALQVYYLGPNVYRFISQYFALPTERTLRKMMKKLKLTGDCKEYTLK